MKRDEWIRSIVSHFSDEETPMREWIYGVGRPKGNEDIYIARYERHNREVMEYFKDRSEQLLVLNITAGEGWTKLCPFLNEQIPSISFPRANIASERKKLHWSKNFWYRKFSRQAKELLRRSTEFIPLLEL